MIFRNLRNTFLAGLAVLLPAVITLWTVWWIVASTENLLAWLLRFFLPEKAYLPGMGWVAAIGFIFLVGASMSTWLFSGLVDLGEKILRRIPLVSTLYGAVRDFADFITQQPEQRFSRVVSVTLPGSDMRVIGFVTREDFSALPNPMADDNTIAVYLPLSYQIGGYTVLLPREQVNAIDMTMEDALRFALTAGMSTRPGN